MAETVTDRYPGAQPFGDDPLSRKLFFGREQETHALTQQILAHRLVVLFGRVGMGKTSLLQAAVAHNLGPEGFIPLIVRIDDRAGGPLASIYRNIEAQCACREVSYQPGDMSSLWSYFKTAEFWRGDILLEPVLIIDQFEDLFTLQTADVRSELIDQLSYVIRGVRPNRPDSGGGASAGKGALNGSPPPMRIVLSLRESFVAYLEELSDRIPEILAERFRLLPLSRESARRAIDQPSAVEDGLLATPPFTLQAEATDAILSFLERKAVRPLRCYDNRVEPFELQLLCQHIEKIARRKAKASSAPVTISLDEIGGERNLNNVLEGFYMRQLAAIPSILERHRVRRLCSEFLISLHGRRLRLEESEIRRLSGVRPTTLEALSRSRLLRATGCAPEGKYYELSHDSLIDPVSHSRRSWFVLRAVEFAAGVASGVMIACLLILSMLRISQPLSWLEREGLLLMGSLILLLIVLYVWRTFPLLKQMWRRLRM